MSLTSKTFLKITIKYSQLLAEKNKHGKYNSKQERKKTTRSTLVSTCAALYAIG